MEIIPKPDSEYRQVNYFSQLTKKGYELLICQNSDKLYYLNGPAIIYSNDVKEYYINNEYYEENEYWEKIFSTEEYIKKLVKFCPICEKCFESREEVAVHLDREMENKTNLLFNNEILIKRINLIITGNI